MKPHELVQKQKHGSVRDGKAPITRNPDHFTFFQGEAFR
jgi:hypothetical protein